MKTWTKISAAAFAALTVAAVAAGCGTSNTSTSSTATGSSASTSTTAASTDSSYIIGKGKMVIGVTLNQPMDYQNAQGDWIGFDAELSQITCKELGIEAEFVKIDWDTKEVELNGKTIDCIWNGLTITPEREENMAITNAYLTNKQVLVVKASNADKYADSANWKGATVVAEKGSAGEEAAQEYMKNASYTGVDSQAKALMEVNSGTADIAVLDYTMANSLVTDTSDYSTLKVINYEGFPSEKYGIAFRKGSDMQQKVNEILQKLTNSGEMKALAEKYNLQDLLVIQPTN